MTGTDLYHRLLAFNHGDKERDALAREVWSPTPWMIDVYTGRCIEDRDREILQWCHSEFGQESSPIHGREGRWHRGGAIINGWTWYGFADEEAMKRFVARWPAPDGIVLPSGGPGT